MSSRRFFFYTYLRSTTFCNVCSPWTKQRRPTLYLPVAATTSNRVRQMDRRNDTAPLNRKCDHCLRSPHWTHSVSAHWGPHKTSTALCCTGCTYTLRASGFPTHSLLSLSRAQSLHFHGWATAQRVFGQTSKYSVLTRNFPSCLLPAQLLHINAGIAATHS